MFYWFLGEADDADDKQTVKITARVGTLKRKRQMRDYLEQLPKDNHDDFFTATPLQKQRIQVRLLSAWNLHFYILLVYITNNKGQDL